MTASSSQRYADPAAFEEYSDNDGQEVMTSVLVNATAPEAFDAWLAHVWLGYTELAPGVGRGLVGYARQVPLGIVEQIVSAGVPNENDEQLIPSICYKLRKYGPMPISDHIGLVRFVQDSSSLVPKTLVLWTIKVTPTTVGNVFFCGGSLLRMSLRSTLTIFLNSMNSKLKKLKNQ